MTNIEVRAMESICAINLKMERIAKALESVAESQKKMAESYASVLERIGGNDASPLQEGDEK